MLTSIETHCTKAIGLAHTDIHLHYHRAIPSNPPQITVLEFWVSTCSMHCPPYHNTTIVNAFLEFSARLPLVSYPVIQRTNRVTVALPWIHWSGQLSLDKWGDNGLGELMMIEFCGYWLFGVIVCSLLTAFDTGDSSPLLTFGKSALMGYANRGNPDVCYRQYPRCPREASAVVDYLNNHNGGFFRFFRNQNSGEFDEL